MAIKVSRMKRFLEKEIIGGRKEVNSAIRRGRANRGSIDIKK